MSEKSHKTAPRRLGGRLEGSDIVAATPHIPPTTHIRHPTPTRYACTPALPTAPCALRNMHRRFPDPWIAVWGGHPDAGRAARPIPSAVQPVALRLTTVGQLQRRAFVEPGTVVCVFVSSAFRPPRQVTSPRIEAGVSETKTRHHLATLTMPFFTGR